MPLSNSSRPAGGSRPGHGLLSAQDTRYHALNISGVAAGTHALELQESSVA